jgi:hypothetical protein
MLPVDVLELFILLRLQVDQLTLCNKFQVIVSLPFYDCLNLPEILSSCAGARPFCLARSLIGLLCCLTPSAVAGISKDRIIDRAAGRRLLNVAVWIYSQGS